jgi:phosphoribosylglycinamide formyltransferase 1
MNAKVVLLTGNELRHDFFRKFIASDNQITVLATFCESDKNDLNQVVKNEEKNSLRLKHLDTRKKTEIDFFGLFCEFIPDKSKPINIDRGEINQENNVKLISDLNPNFIISYGCSIIKSDLLIRFKGKFINIHLGLSPYYRGSGTNFWPFINKELQFIGTTFMHIDEGIDTGEIIHQIRADIAINDNIHQIGNRLIKNSFQECIKIIKNFNYLKEMVKINFDKKEERYYRKKDFTEHAITIANKNLKDGLVENYLINKEDIDKKYPIITNSFFL